MCTAQMGPLTSYIPSMQKHDFQHSENEMRNVLLPQAAALESEMAQTLYSKTNSPSPTLDQLPAEIKVEIFYNALLNDGNVEGKGSLVTPFLLGKICQGWRDFVWSSPILWTNLHLCLSRNRYKTQTNLLHDWLSRSAKYPLRIHLTTVGSQDDWIYDPLKDILTVFASVSTQWKEIDFFLPDSQECFDAISAAENSLPLLTTATIHFDSDQRQFNLFSTAPKLSVLHLHDFYLFKVLAPWHQLQEFCSGSCTVDEIRGLLHKVPNLIRCTFRDIDSIILEEPLGSDIFVRLPVLEHLEYLELCFDFVGTESTQILGPVKLPSLHEVSLHGPFASSQQLDILPLIMSSFHSSRLLERFTLGRTIPSDHDLIQVLENIPSVKELRLDFRYQDSRNELLTKEFLQRLCHSHADILLPNLQSFVYYGPTPLNDHIPLFRDVLVYRFRQCTFRSTELDSKQGTVCQIQSVIVITASQLVISPDLQDEIDSLMQEGLQLSLISTSSFI